MTDQNTISDISAEAISTIYAIIRLVQAFEILF